MAIDLVFKVPPVKNVFILIGKGAGSKCSFGLSLELVSFGGHHEVACEVVNNRSADEGKQSSKSQKCRSFRILSNRLN